MQIIPVVDIRRGQVVHARGGLRESYQTIRSVLTEKTEPLAVVADLLDYYPFPQIYFADLDAIETGRANLMLYQQLDNAFPQLNIWLDMGIQHAQDVWKLSAFTSISPVIGSETLLDPALLQDAELRAQAILSIDKKGDQLLGQIDLVQTPQYWPRRVIAMQLANIGSGKGPCYQWISQIQALNSQVNVYAAGGIKEASDLMKLKQKKIAGVLLATALHNGKIDQAVVATCMEQEHCPSS